MNDQQQLAKLKNYVLKCNKQKHFSLFQESSKMFYGSIHLTHVAHLHIRCSSKQFPCNSKWLIFEELSANCVFSQSNCLFYVKDKGKRYKKISYLLLKEFTNLSSRRFWNRLKPLFSKEIINHFRRSFIQSNGNYFAIFRYWKKKTLSSKIGGS